MSNVKIKLLDNDCMPRFAHEGDACMDCRAKIGDVSISIPSGSRCLVSLGFCIQVPKGYEAVIRPRSGLSKNGIDVAIGTIDSNYTGEVKANVINNSLGPFTINNHDRICQLAIRKTEDFEIETVETLEETSRGENGFGSSGLK